LFLGINTKKGIDGGQTLPFGCARNEEAQALRQKLKLQKLKSSTSEGLEERRSGRLGNIRMEGWKNGILAYTHNI